MDALSIADYSNFELEDMFEEGLRCMQECSVLIKEEPLGRCFAENKQTSNLESNDSTVSLPIKFLIAGSSIFLSSLLSLKTNSIFCTLIDSVVSNFVSRQQLRGLAEGGLEIQENKVGCIVYTSRKCDSDSWYVLCSGRLKVTLDDLGVSKVDNANFEIISGEIFGGYNIAECRENTKHVIIRTTQPSTYIQLQGKHLKDLLKRDLESAGRLLLMMGGM